MPVLSLLASMRCSRRVVVVVRALLLLLGLPALVRAQAAGPVTRAYRARADRIVAAALADSAAAWNRLARFTDFAGARLSGSASLERGLDWLLEEMRKDGLENVRSEPVMVPHWERGRESATLLEPHHSVLPMLGLGGSIGTPDGGIAAEVLVVSGFDELTRRAAEAHGKIVLFDVPFTTYPATVPYRVYGAIAAARAGAVASLVRSVTPFSLRTPHTGSMNYDSTVTAIPGAALTVEDAEMLHRMQDRGERIALNLQMGAQTLPDAPSRNVMAELRGSTTPDEVVVIGGHSDSWDVGAGAIDDGGGVVVAWEAVRLLKRLGLRPRRTIRVVAWTNEENGFRGGSAYKDAHRSEVGAHVLAIESDGGVFSPLGFGFTGSDSARAIVRQVSALLTRVDADKLADVGGGPDISPLMQLGVPGLALLVEGPRTFWFHHTEADTVDKLDPVEMQKCVAAMAVMAFVVADLPEPLPRAAR